MKVVMPMAGLGTRLRPHTYSKAKPLLPVAGKPILAHLLDRLQGLDVEEYVFIVGHLGEQIEKYVEANYDLPARFVLQAEPLGQAHALHLSREYIDSPFLLIFVDTIFEADLARIDEVASDGLVFVKEVDDPRRFGIALLEGDRVVRLIEKPEEPLSNLALVGMYYVVNWSLLMGCVETLLEELGLGEIAVLPVFNKRDRAPREAALLARRYLGLAISAGDGEGLERLVGQIVHRLSDIGAWSRREAALVRAAVAADEEE